MVSVALDPAYRRVSVEEFLAMDFGGAKAELEDGLVFMMAGGTARHSFVAGNVFMALRTRLRGTACRTFSSDLAARTGERTVRFPDVSVYCSPGERDDDLRQLIGDPTLVFEVLSPSTAQFDQRTKLEEYRQLSGLKAVILVDPEREMVRLVERRGDIGWYDSGFLKDPQLHIATPSLTIPLEEIFARD